MSTIQRQRKRRKRKESSTRTSTNLPETPPVGPPVGDESPQLGLRIEDVPVLPSSSHIPPTTEEPSLNPPSKPPESPHEIQPSSTAPNEENERDLPAETYSSSAADMTLTIPQTTSAPSNQESDQQQEVSEEDSNSAPKEEAKETTDSAAKKAETPSFFKFANITNTLINFKNKTQAKREARLKRMQQIHQNQKDRVLSALPLAIQVQVIEDALPVVFASVEEYKNQLGASHPITMQAIRHARKVATIAGIVEVDLPNIVNLM
ncbi:hypothetical protein P9112_012048 [Eukaryota sp. TZLM1-RC]